MTSLAAASGAEATDASVSTIQALRVAVPPVVDGRLDDEAWVGVPAVSGFRQRDPDEGIPASESTEIRVAYTGDSLFVAIRMLDRSASEIVRRVSRRDTGSDADSVAVYLDPRHDHLTGFRFSVSAAGVQEDGVIYQDDRIDGNWDAVWSSAVSVDGAGWSVELEIPFSQIRFPQSTERIWGVNVARYIHRRNETSWLQLVPKAERGLASRMAHLSGIDIEQPASLELMPFSTVRREMTNAKPGDPFNDGSRSFGALGLDLRWGLTSGTRLTATVNPDFGQVEVDPSVVNLTAFETFYAEKRPFFLEGAEIFDRFGGGSSPFYSRRIGTAPRGSVSGDYVDRPAFTTILGAAKVVGRTSSGWSFGALTAVTDNEIARTTSAGRSSTVEVEPFTGYSVGRVRWDGSRAGLGGIATTVHRNLRSRELHGLLLARAYVGGGDGYVYLDNDRDWVLTGGLTGSWIQGSTAALAHQQRSSRRYYQRLDATHLHLDPGATGMNGWATAATLNGNGGFWTVEGSLNATSPGYEINDLGFQQRADEIRSDWKVLFQALVPDRFSRYRWVSLSKANSWNYARESQQDDWWIGGGITFPNYWYANANVSIQTRTLDDRLTRGGPLTSSPFRHIISAGMGSDKRKTLSFSLNASRGKDELGGWSTNLSTWMTVKPSDTFNLSFGPSLYDARSLIQYVTENGDPVAVPTFGTRYIFSTLDQNQVSLTTRADFAFTNTLSLELYAEPFVAAGDYFGLKQLETPRTLNFFQYGADGGAIELNEVSQTYRIDPGDGGRAFVVRSPDFNVKSLVLKSVFRWEWHPGSTLYFVWTQNRYDPTNPGDFDFGRDLRAAFGAPADDVFLVKFSYWMGS